MAISEATAESKSGPTTPFHVTCRAANPFDMIGIARNLISYTGLIPVVNQTAAGNAEGLFKLWMIRNAGALTHQGPERVNLI